MGSERQSMRSRAGRVLTHRVSKGEAGAELRISAATGPYAARAAVQIEQLLADVAEELAREGIGPDQVLRQTLFFDAGREGEEQERILRWECRDRLMGFYGGAARLPATAYVHQPPLGGGAVALEVLAHGRGTAGPPPLRVSEHLSVQREGPVRRAYLAMCGPSPGQATAAAADDLFAQGLEALDRAESELVSAGFGLHQVVRTWFYIPRLLEQGSEGAQRYQRFNDARSVFYGRSRSSGLLECLLRPGRGPCSCSVYPASTGIGARAGPLVVEMEALDPGAGSVWVCPVENPKQESAYCYPNEVLVGGGPLSRPLFSRALLEVAEGKARILVSGTASIREARTLHVGDVAAQADLTLDNIEVLISEENLQAYGYNGGWGLSDLSQIRVYLKEGADLDIVRQVCERRCKGVPALYLQANVCREDLLVEIEALG